MISLINIVFQMIPEKRIVGSLLIHTFIKLEVSFELKRSQMLLIISTSTKTVNPKY